MHYKLANGTSVISDPDSGGSSVITRDQRLFTLNRTATLVVGQLDGEAGLQGAMEALRRWYPNIPAETLRADLDALLDQLTRFGVVTT